MTTKPNSNATNKDPAQTEERQGAANAIAGVAAACCALPVVVFARSFWGTAGVIAAGLFAAAVLYFALRRFRPQNRIVCALSALAALAGIYSAEFVLTSRQSRLKTIAATARRLGRTADLRTLTQVVEDFRSKGVTAYPCCVSVGDYAHLPGAREILPLASRSNLLHVMCNESGSYVTFTSDEHGFHNPPGMWKADAQVVVIGDSFTEGFCVPADQHYVGLVRQRFPATVNLGLRGSGSLLQLAVLKEYATLLKPHVVIWAFFENDLDDLPNENAVPGLSEYLKPGYGQHLASRQPEIDKMAELVIQDVSDSREARARAEQWEDRLKLTTVRKTVGAASLIRAPAPAEREWQMFTEILQQAKSETESWGGTLYLAYLPGMEHFVKLPRTPVVNLLHERTLAIAGTLGITAIDVLPEFAAHPNASSLFFYPGSHYSEEGYALTAKAILAKLPNSLAGVPLRPVAK